MNSMAWITVFTALLSVPTLSSFEVSTSQTNTCVVNDGEVKCWGENGYGQLGIGNKVDQWAPMADPIDLGSDFMADSLECGQDFCCALSTEKDVKCFGKCKFIGCYNLGYGDGLGDEEDELGDNLPIVFPSFVGVVDMVALQRMVCVLAEDADGAHFIECVGYDITGNIWKENQDDTPWNVVYSTSWGSSRLVNTADEDTAHLDLSGRSWTPSGLGGGHITLCVFDSTTVGALECHGKVAVDEERTGSLFIESVYCGRWHCCAKSTSGSVVCWGGSPTSTKYGQNEVQPLIVEDNVQDYAVAKFSACVLSTDGMLSCFGYDQLDDGPFDISSSFSDVSEVHLAHSRSAEFDFCLYEDAANPKVQCFGRNSEGQLGYGDQVARTSAEGLDDVDLLLPVSAHIVARGDPDNSNFDGDVDSYCQSDDDNQAKYESTTHDYDIGVGCCSADGQTGYRPDCGAHPATYQEAVDLCSSNGHRLCTEEEMLSKVTKHKGCGYDAAYNWVSDECTNPVSVGASIAVSGGAPSIAEGVGEEDEAFLWMETVFGALIGVVVIGAVVLLTVLMVKRRRSLGKKEETEMCRAVHVEEVSPSEVVDATTTAEAENMESV